MKKIDLLKKIEEAKIKHKAGNSLEANQIFQVLLKSNNDSFDLLYAYGLFSRDLKNYIKKAYIKVGLSLCVSFSNTLRKRMKI